MLDLSTLNDRQRSAVTAPTGPVLVLAGAGSGKTRALAYRIAYLIAQKVVAAQNILALTFTNKAAKEMSERVSKLLGGLGAGPTMGTFHSVCARILRRDIGVLGYTSEFSIYDADDQIRVFKGIVQDLGISNRFPPSLFRAYVSSAKNILQLPGDFSIGLEPDMHNLAQQVYARYQDFLTRQNALDFDDLIMLTVKLFEHFPDVLGRYRAQFRYVLVDEYQDTNHAQYVLLHLLAGAHQNLFVVGDDAQSIYGFRGSNIRNILNFEADFPGCLVVKLEQNYRSTKRILAAAQKVIELNVEQKPKTLWTDNDLGAAVTVRELPDEMAEARFVAREIVRLAGGQDGELTYEEDEGGAEHFSILDHFLKKRKGRGAPNAFLPQLPEDHRPLSDFAVLFRTHAQSRVLEEAFIASGVPYQIVGGVRFYERKEVKDVLAYVRLALNYRDLVSLQRVINEPPRRIGEKTFQAVRELVFQESGRALSGGTPTPLEDFTEMLRGMNVGARACEAVLGFFDLIGRLQRLEPSGELRELLTAIVKLVGFERSLRDGTEMGESRWENVQELMAVAVKFGGVPWREGATQLLEEVALITDADEVQGDADKVTLMTLHAAKGLEFDTVFFTGLEEGVLPHTRSLTEPSELSEEVRLAYVGLTRAKRRLFLSFASARRSFGNLKHNLPSRILSALPKEGVEFQVRSGVSLSGEESLEYADP